MRPDFSVRHSPRLTKRKGAPTRSAPPTMPAARAIHWSAVMRGSPTGTEHARAQRLPVDHAQALARKDQHECDALQHQHRRIGQPEPPLQQAARRAEAAEQDRHRHDGHRVVPRNERHEDARVAIPRDQRGVGVGVHRRHLDRAREARAGTAESAGPEDEPRGRQAHELRGARIAADHAHRETRGRRAQPPSEPETGHDADHETPVHVGAADAADQQPVVQRIGRWLVQARRIAQRPFDQVLEDADGDVGQQQAADGFVDAAVLAQPPREHDPQRAGECACDADHHRAHDIGGQRHRMRERGAGQAAEHQRAFTADDDQPRARGQRHAQRGEHQRCGALQGVLPREPVAERALEERRPHLHRIDAGKGDEHAEQQQRRRDGEHRQGEFLERAIMGMVMGMGTDLGLELRPGR
jgi:hypothetical protein